MRIEILGAGVAGLTAAFELARQGAERGVEIELVETRPQAGMGCSRFAGGMIAPWCELETAEPIVAELGAEAIDFWADLGLATIRGSLVVAPPREPAELRDFSRRTRNFEALDAAGLARLEPDLEGRFESALYFPTEAHLDPRAAMAALGERLAHLANVTLRFGAEPRGGADWTIDCRGFSARDQLARLRGVKGEMLVLRSEELKLSRPVRMLHPRRPVYVVPRGNGIFMIGATMIENEEAARVTARSVVELVNSAFAIHPAFAEAEIVEMGSDVRPAYPDNLPRLTRRGRALYINGLYRHGFLLAPALARRAARVVLEDAWFPEVCDADSD
ncbi:FAD-dependent oxidoreductase [Methylocystis heyeri]|uniref:FAD-dependent oxidoreductase n=1 Tax=Methylocystis heyeri TaxID=391905 RepID=A0A6B8KFT3_9HYPH|nr:FAD-dependent oxidoreductase [Methylocystis heyeri]QGM46587.1 FAD-dependent oxidoreductase [Methylocystis heyeri]